jgi:hypothetical protein
MTLGSHLTLVRIAVMNKTTTNPGEDVGKKNLLSTVGGNKI